METPNKYMYYLVLGLEYYLRRTYFWVVLSLRVETLGG